MRLPSQSSASSAASALPPLLAALTLFPLFFSGHTEALADASFELPDAQIPKSTDAFGDDNALKRLDSRHDDLAPGYVPDFIGINRGIIGRAGDDIQALANNQPGKPQNGLQSGQSQYYSFPKSALLGPKSPSTSGLPSSIQRRDSHIQRLDLFDELKKRQTQPQLFITLSTCSQPLPNPNTNGGAGQLQVFISTSSSNQKPSQGSNNYAVAVDGGYGSQTLTAGDDVFLSVSAPNNDGFTGNYDYELTASIDNYYAIYNDQVYSQVVDTDTQSVLLYTNDVTSENSSTSIFQQWLTKKPFSVYVYNQSSPAIIGIQKSSCAFDAHKQRYLNPASESTNMTIAVDGQPKQQFHVQGLNGSSPYYASLVIEGNSTNSGGGVVNGGGTVWPYVNFTTKSDNNCVIVANLPFCSDVGYAVPWNPYSSDDTSLRNSTALGLAYDNKAVDAYVFFNKSLQQVPCNTTSSAQYSLARNCTDCADAYKQWLCAVTMPRCEDFTNDASYLRPRAVSQPFPNPALNNTSVSQYNATIPYMNSSRNAWIDTAIIPGPYKEVLPCRELCYNLVQSCPAVLQFACPLPGFGLETSYGFMGANLPPGRYTCNWMALDISGGSRLMNPSLFGFAMTTFAILAVVVV